MRNFLLRLWKTCNEYSTAVFTCFTRRWQIFQIKNTVFLLSDKKKYFAIIAKNFIRCRRSQRYRLWIYIPKKNAVFNLYLTHEIFTGMVNDIDCVLNGVSKLIYSICHVNTKKAVSDGEKNSACGEANGIYLFVLYGAKRAIRKLNL